MDLEAMCLKVCTLVRETGNFIREESKKFTIDKVEVKGLNNFVTYVDKTSEQKLIMGLSKILPEAGFIAEEGSVKETNVQYRWVIDPLDGNTNFIHGLPPYSISVALMDEKLVILGVVLEVSSNECFYAWKGSKAYLNDSEISVTKVSAVKDALIATGFPYYDYTRIKPFLKSLDYLFVHSHGVRRLGSAAADLVYVACGRFEAFYEYSLNSWDVAAGSLIVQQAGGKITDFNGSDNYIFGKEIIATNTIIYPEFYKIVSKYLKK
jgi:myo-inositol-1(or 4)-monophosphatase